MSKKPQDRKRAGKPAKATKKAAPVKTAKKAAKAAKPRHVAAHAKATKRQAVPRDAPLPTMAQPRNAVLERLCVSVEEQRAVMNAARAQEKGDLQAALQEMQRRDLSQFVYAGVELTRVTGADKLRVRVVDDEGTTAGAVESDGVEDPADTDAAELMTPDMDDPFDDAAEVH